MPFPEILRSFAGANSLRMTSEAMPPQSGKTTERSKVKMDKEPRSIETIEAELEDLRGRLPAHSVKPHMIMQLEELEDELEAAKKRAASSNG